MSNRNEVAAAYCQALETLKNNGLTSSSSLGDCQNEASRNALQVARSLKLRLEDDYC